MPGAQSSSRETVREAHETPSGRRKTHSGIRLLWRIFAVGGVILVADAVLLTFAPRAIDSPPGLTDGLVVAGGLVLMLVLTLGMLRWALAPLEQIAHEASQIDAERPGRRFPQDSRIREVLALQEAFNAMLARLEAGQRERVLAQVRGQERERRRLSRELHDEIGQDVTAALLLLDPDGGKEEIAAARGVLKETLTSVRRIVSELRPEALDELGLPSALASLVMRLSERSDLTIEVNLDCELPPLTDEQELVLYRVAQEGLANAIRHGQAAQAQLSLDCSDEAVVLRVVDDGRGMDGSRPGNGIRGMHERAFLVAATVSISPGPTRGTQLELEVPLP